MPSIQFHRPSWVKNTPALNAMTTKGALEASSTSISASEPEGESRPKKSMVGRYATRASFLRMIAKEQKRNANAGLLGLLDANVLSEVQNYLEPTDTNQLALSCSLMANNLREGRRYVLQPTTVDLLMMRIYPNQRKFLSRSSCVELPCDFLRTRPSWSDRELINTVKILIEDGVLNSVKSLGFSKYPFFDRGGINFSELQHLSKLNQLEHLDLSLFSDDITDADLQHLAGLKQLKHLDLSWCRKITDNGLQSLREELPQLTIITQPTWLSNRF